MTTVTGTRPAVDIGARTAAWTSGLVGIVANLLLVLFFALARPYDVHSTWSWLGPANDTLIVAQLATLVPVVVALADRVPATRALRWSTAGAVLALLAGVVLQVLLVAEVLAFETQVGLVVLTFLALYAWILHVSLTGHRTAALPRPVTRLGVLIGAAFPIGMVLAGAGYLLPEPARWVPVGLGIALGGPAWLALPVFPLVLATRVFRPESNKELP
jgi:hypothetical protein